MYDNMLAGSESLSIYFEKLWKNACVIVGSLKPTLTNNRKFMVCLNSFRILGLLKHAE